jgi:hypothetical protein
MKVKWIEIRDKATFIPALAVEISSDDGYLARRAGFGSRMIQVIHFASGRTAYSPYDWTNRTMQVAHNFVAEFWDKIESGAVIDVQFILGETRAPKESEALGGGF